MMTARFVIYAAPRTGSNLLCSLLNSHPEILCHHGLFNPRGIHYALDHRDGDPDFGTAEERDRDSVSFLEAVWRYDGGKRAVGFKFNRGEHAAAHDAVARDTSVHKILLRRRNRIKTYVSERIADATGAWENYDGRETMPQRIVVDPPALAQHADANERYYAAIEETLHATNQPWLEVDYEALQNGGVAPILALLGVDAHAPLTAGSYKQNPDDLRELVANFEEVRLALAGTPFEADLT